MSTQQKPLAERFWSKVDKITAAPCWLWTGARSRKTGYGHITVWIETGQYRTVSTHQVAWELTYGPILPGFHVCHNCPEGDNRLCVNPHHLFLGTPGDNIRDAWKKGRIIPMAGERNGQRKITPAIVLAIRSLRGKYPLAVLAAQFGVSRSGITAIWRRESWHELPEKEDQNANR